MSIEVNFYVQLILLVVTFAVLYRLIRTDSAAEKKVKEALKQKKKD